MSGGCLDSEDYTGMIFVCSCQLCATGVGGSQFEWGRPQVALVAHMRQTERSCCDVAANGGSAGQREREPEQLAPTLVFVVVDALLLLSPGTISS